MTIPKHRKRGETNRDEAQASKRGGILMRTGLRIALIVLLFASTATAQGTFDSGSEGIGYQDRLCPGDSG